MKGTIHNEGRFPISDEFRVNQATLEYLKLHIESEVCDRLLKGIRLPFGALSACHRNRSVLISPGQEWRRLSKLTLGWRRRSEPPPQASCSQRTREGSSSPHVCDRMSRTPAATMGGQRSTSRSVIRSASTWATTSETEVDCGLFA